jgi:hypothetical protein
MKTLGALFGFIVLAAVFVLWYRAYKSIKGDDSALFPSGREKPAKTSSLEEFIASYKRGEVVVGDDASTSLKANQGAKSASQPPIRLVAGYAETAPSSPPAKREAFVSGTTKLAYLACRAGLRDHHVFAHVQLCALSEGTIDPSLAAAGIDLLICNAGLSAVAAIDLIDAASGPADAIKTDYLKTLGIRYLRLSAKSLPRPADWHALLYKM